MLVLYLTESFLVEAIPDVYKAIWSTSGKCVVSEIIPSINNNIKVKKENVFMHKFTHQKWRLFLEGNKSVTKAKPNKNLILKVKSNARNFKSFIGVTPLVPSKLINFKQRQINVWDSLPLPLEEFPQPLSESLFGWA